MKEIKATLFFFFSEKPLYSALALCLKQRVELQNREVYRHS